MCRQTVGLRVMLICGGVSRVFGWRRRQPNTFAHCGVAAVVVHGWYKESRDDRRRSFFLAVFLFKQSGVSATPVNH